MCAGRITLFLAIAVSCVADERWAAVTKTLEEFPRAHNFAFSAGDATGRKYAFEKGKTKMTTQLLMASSSKFPAAVAIVGVVRDGHLSLDTFVHEVWPWWTSDPRDRRSRVRLRHLLSFTSGFYAWDPSGEVPCLTSPRASLYTAEACAREIYEHAPFKFEPGTTFSYNSFHLQVAGALAATAANITVQDLLLRYLITPANMTATKWVGGKNPFLAAAMVTTADDYDKFLRAYVAYELVPKPLADQMEVDYLSPPWMKTAKAQFASESLLHKLGHYSMCNYFECLVKAPWATFTPKCKAENIHMDAGLFGYYPLIDRARGTYMQLAQAMVLSSPLMIPTSIATTLRLNVKDFVDLALENSTPTIDMQIAARKDWRISALPAEPAPSVNSSSPQVDWSKFARALAMAVGSSAFDLEGVEGVAELLQLAGFSVSRSLFV